MMKQVTLHLPEQSDFNLTGEEKAAMWTAVNNSWKRAGTNFIDMGLCLKVINQAVGQLNNSLASPFNIARSTRDPAFGNVYNNLISDVSDIQDAVRSIQRFENGQFVGTMTTFFDYLTKKAPNQTPANAEPLNNIPAPITSADGGAVATAMVGLTEMVARIAARLDNLERNDPHSEEADAARQAAAEQAERLHQMASLKTGKREAA